MALDARVRQRSKGSPDLRPMPEKALIQDTPTLIDRDRTAHNLLNRNEFLGDWSG